MYILRPTGRVELQNQAAQAPEEIEKRPSGFVYSGQVKTDTFY